MKDLSAFSSLCSIVGRLCNRRLTRQIQSYTRYNTLPSLGCSSVWSHPVPAWSYNCRAQNAFKRANAVLERTGGSHISQIHMAILHWTRRWRWRRQLQIGPNASHAELSCPHRGYIDQKGANFGKHCHQCYDSTFVL